MKSYTIPSYVTFKNMKYRVCRIGKNAFKNNKSIKKIIIGSDVTKIEKNAFKRCNKLRYVVIKSKKIRKITKE